ncbi:hypothetical protein BRE01_41700 [Brevibacillus reuszeri]|uniref:Uncharacterized protein n=1 Tax=Brevibacillus reuszeri TaxID=54915 RepID=A0ABQ0TRA5_9BACL|nr:hypothetical protein [Brevibacillus reuszeri]MED1861018.1 hypothetical protein [Brevibacillus reuszeri]GED70468.1 hypothetical protein BRE01_41700 [Brevibacillus reuszeri]
MATWNLASNDELKEIIDDDTIDYTIRKAKLCELLSRTIGESMQEA